MIECFTDIPEIASSNPIGTKLFCSMNILLGRPLIPTLSRGIVNEKLFYKPRKILLVRLRFLRPSYSYTFVINILLVDLINSDSQSNGIEHSIIAMM